MQKKYACEKMLFRNIWETKRVTGLNMFIIHYIHVENCQKYILKSNKIDT